MDDCLIVSSSHVQKNLDHEGLLRILHSLCLYIFGVNRIDRNGINRFIHQSI